MPFDFDALAGHFASLSSKYGPNESAQREGGADLDRFSGHAAKESGPGDGADVAAGASQGAPAADPRYQEVSEWHLARRAVLAELCSAGLEHVDASTVEDLIDIDPTGLASGKPLVRVLVEQFASEPKEA